MDACLKFLYRCLTGRSADQNRPSEQDQNVYEDVYVPPVLPPQRPPQQQSWRPNTQQSVYPGVVGRPQPFGTPSHLPSHPPASPSPPHHPASPQSHHAHSPSPDRNQFNQNNEHYKALRARANEEADKMASCFERGHAAYEAGDRALAKELSNEGKAHQREMERLNAQASDWIYIENNKDSKLAEVDLHGLYVKEAIQFADRVIQEARDRGDAKLNLIVGKGLHSASGVAKLKPAIEDLVQKHGLIAELDEHNDGVLIVSLDGQTTGVGRVLQPDDITRGLEKKDTGCTIM